MGDMMTTGTTSDRIAALERKQAQIAERLKALTAQETARARKEDTRRKIVIGAAVIAHAEIDEEFAKQLRAVLAKAVTRAVDRKLVADLLG